MNKIFLIIILLFLSSCGVQRITEVLYIASIGFEKSEDEFVGYFYLPSSDDVGKTNEGGISGKGEYMKVSGKSISEVFQKSQDYTEMEVNLKHISSVVFNKNILNSSFINEFVLFVKNSNIVDFNFYIFVTEEKMEDIYSFQNPNKESVLNSILVSTFDNSYSFLAVEPIHFLRMVREFFLNKCIAFPLIVVEEIWNINDKFSKSYSANDIAYYQNNEVIVSYDESSYLLKCNKDFIVNFNDINIKIDEYKLDIKYKDNIEINIKVKYAPLLDSNVDENIVEFNIKRRIGEYLKNIKLDILNIQYMNNILKRDYQLSSMQIYVVASGA